MENQQKCILIVDDDQTVIKMMRIYFQNSGMSAVVADSGVKALAAIDEYNPDLMILDIKMPQMDGVKVCQAIRREKGNKTLPIIAVTGFHSDSKQKDIMAAGANLYLTKPLDMSGLLKKVKELMSSSEQ